MGHMEPLRLAGRILPTDEPAEFWVVDGAVTFEPVAGARTITESGYFLPGLVDAHCHLGLGELGAVDEETFRQQALTDLNAGVMLVRDCGAPANTRILDDDDAMPKIIRAGRHLARTRRYIRFAAHEIEPEQLCDFMVSQALAGDGWVKLVGDWIDRSIGDLAPSFPADVVREGIEAAHELGARVTAHCFAEQSVRELVEAGVDCIEHGTGLDEDTVKQMASRSVALVPTMINLANFPSYAEQGAAKFPRYSAHMMDLYSRRYETIEMAYRAGVQIYAGTDAGTVVRHGRIVDEIVELAKIAGAEFALGAASWRARTWLGRNNIDEGASADFLVFDRDPRSDLEILRAPEKMMLRGKVVGDE